MSELETLLTEEPPLKEELLAARFAPPPYEPEIAKWLYDSGSYKTFHAAKVAETEFRRVRFQRQLREVIDNIDGKNGVDPLDAIQKMCLVLNTILTYAHFELYPGDINDPDE